ncbi:MAG TPA: histidinol dehydrogenase, partial [Desulfobacterales bacterium]|nr:histidinol dehydrogenase [Desulfobacterales bacterium]
DNFVKRTSLIHYSADAFRREAADILRLAEVEGLGAHANSIRVRLNRQPGTRPSRKKADRAVELGR